MRQTFSDNIRLCNNSFYNKYLQNNNLIVKMKSPQTYNKLYKHNYSVSQRFYKVIIRTLKIYVSLTSPRSSMLRSKSWMRDEHSPVIFKLTSQIHISWRMSWVSWLFQNTGWRRRLRYSSSINSIISVVCVRSFICWRNSYGSKLQTNFKVYKKYSTEQLSLHLWKFEGDAVMHCQCFPPGLCLLLWSWRRCGYAAASAPLHSSASSFVQFLLPLLLVSHNSTIKWSATRETSNPNYFYFSSFFEKKKIP